MVVVAQSLREQVAWACRILASEGYADLTLGHISARGPDGEVWIKRKGVALDEVEPDDVVPLDDTDAVLHLETVLHTGVYRSAAGRRRRRPRPPAVRDRARRDVGRALAADPRRHPLRGRRRPVRRPRPDRRRRPGRPRRGGTRAASRRADAEPRRARRRQGRARGPSSPRSPSSGPRSSSPSASTLGELRPISRELALQLLPVKYRDEFVDEYWAAWQRRVARNGGGLGGDRA